jgi:tRNA U54 and U55 pseudouridine synthase Pus10
MKYKIINGEKVPVLPASAREVIKNKRTGQKYKDKDEFQADVLNPATDTTVDDFGQDVEITVASLTVSGKTN